MRLKVTTMSMYGKLFPKWPSLLDRTKISKRKSHNQVEKLRMAQAHLSGERVYKEAMPAKDVATVPKAYIHRFCYGSQEKKVTRKNT